MSEQTEFASGDVLIVADGRVVEVFHRSYEQSYRTPSAWVAVRAQVKKDEVECKFGQAKQPGQPMYGEDVDVQNYRIVFRIPVEDEPRLRAFFADAAARAGRA